MMHFVVRRSYIVLYDPKDGKLLAPYKRHYYLSYLCNQACGVTKKKCTRDWKKVGCNNCLRRKK